MQAHLVSGKPVAGEEIGLRVDQCLLTDTNGSMAWLQFEAMEYPRVIPKVVVTYIDHNVYQTDSRNTDDHRYLQTAARRYGSWFSKPGNGICHQVHFETFSVPGQFVLGTDSHTPLCGSTGMLAIGAGGLDVAVAMGGGAYHLPMPKVVRVWLTGELPPWVHAKDVILELLRRYSVRGGSGKIFEYGGPGAATLSLPQRATICNMGAELTLTTSVFPSDEATRAYFALLGREAEWRPLAADPDAEYDEQIELDLSALVPLVALPASPDKVVPVSEVEGTALEQVMVGSCTNSSWEDMWAVARTIRGERVSGAVSFVVFPGSQPHPRDHVARGAPHRSPRRRRHRVRAHLRLLRGHRARARGGGQEPARLQPEFLRAKRREGRSGLSLLAAHRRRLRAHRRHHRSAQRGAPPAR